jgi:hypothetical protein
VPRPPNPPRRPLSPSPKLAEFSAGLRKSAAGFRLPSGAAADRAGSSGMVQRLEDATLNTAKVRQIASLGGS